MRTGVILLFLSIITKGFSQEKGINPSREIVNRLETSHEIIIKTIEAIHSIKNIEYIYENKSTIPYLPAAFHQPFISKGVVSVIKTDTIQGAAFKFYILEDSFKLKSIYDSKYLVYIDDDGKRNVADISKDPLSAYGALGSLHLRIKTLLENAIDKNAEIEITANNDSLRLEITFNNLHIEFAPGRIQIAKDTIGFISKYTVYVNKYTYLPIKYMRKMPYQTSIETILFQRHNFTDSLTISAHSDDLSYQQHILKSDSLIENKLENTLIKNWKLMEVEGDSMRSSDFIGKKYMLVFNSVGWRPCELAIPFLKQLKKEHSDNNFEIISIEPYITDVDVLKNYKRKHEINYPLLLADNTTKKTYPTLQVPVFIIIDKQGIIRTVISGFTGKNTKDEILKSIRGLL